MRFFQGLLLLSLLLWNPPAFAADDGGNFPFADPFVATILGTPLEQRAPLVEDINVKLLDLTIFPERKVPDIFCTTSSCAARWPTRSRKRR